MVTNVKQNSMKMRMTLPDALFSVSLYPRKTRQEPTARTRSPHTRAPQID